MATRVEINSTLASLTTVPDLNELRSEDKSQRVYVSVLSNASNKTKEASTSLTLEENRKFGSTLRSATMPSLGSRPRLFPKPFSKDKSSDTFANVKPPVPAFRSSSLIRKGTEETSSLKVLGGSVPPPLVDQKVIENENKAGSEVVTNMTFYTGPSANTVILFEAGGTEQSKVSLAQEKRAAEDHKVFSTVQTKELQCNAKLEKPSQPPETPRNTEGSLHRQMSLSSSLRPVSWNSLKTGERKEAYEAHPGEKTSDDADNIKRRVDLSTDVQQKPKPRPVSAIFLESLRDQKHHTVEAPEDKSPAEKSWPRKPRPLSMDLTAKFEQKDPSSCKKIGSSHESKENVPIISFTDLGCRDQSETGPKPEETEFDKGSSATNLKCSIQDIGILNNGKYLWETKLKSKSEQIETKPEVKTDLHSSDRSHEAASESRTWRGGKRLDQKEPYQFLGCESPAAASEKENNIVRGSVKKHISLFTSENPSTSGDTELLPSSAEKENRCVTIQQRIKELTTESTEAKPGNLRRSLQSRPLSADLTKMFSSPTSSGEAKPEKPAETRNDSINDVQENPKVRKRRGVEWSAASTLVLQNTTSPATLHGSGERAFHSSRGPRAGAWSQRVLCSGNMGVGNCRLRGTERRCSKEMKLAHGTDFAEAHAAGSPWKSRQVLKITNKPDQMERKGSFLGDSQRFSQQSENSVSFTSNLEKKIKPTTPVEKTYIKTVRATMFDHHVQRHHVAAEHPGTDSALKTSNGLEGKPDVMTWGHSRRSWMAEVEEIAMFTSQSVLREARDFFSSECTLPEQRKDSNKSETGPVLIAEKIPYSANKSKCLGVSGTEPYELRTSFDREVTLTSAGKYGAQSSSVLPSGQVCKSAVSCHPDRKAPTANKEEAVGLRKSLDLNGKEQVCGLDSAAAENSRTVRVIDPEEKVRRTRSNVSDLKISERWRRRTLPQDFIKTEEVVWLPPENIRRLSRTESLQLDEGSVKKRSKKSTEGLEGNEANRAVLGSADDYLKSQSSAFEPKATYFAVTYQAPGNNKEKSCVGAPSAGETKTISSSSEAVTVNLDPVFPGRSKHLLQQPRKNAMSTSHREDSWQVHISKDWVKEENKDDVFSKTIPFGDFNVSRKDNQQYHEKGLDHSKEKFVDVDAFLLKQDLGSTAQTDLKSSRRKVSSYHDPRSPPLVAQLHEDSEVVPQKKSGNTYDVSGRKAEDAYRSQILDIDALMAEYKEESVKAGGVQGRLSEDLGSFSREKSKNKRNVAERRDRAEECHRLEKSILNERSKEKPQSGSPEFDKQMSKDRKFSPPYWGSPSSLLSDKFVSSPTEFSRKKTFIIDEDEELSLTSRNQSSKFVIDKVQPISAVGTDQRWEVNFASKLSLKADDGLVQKKLVTKEQFLEVSAEGDWSKNVARSSITRSKDNANKVTCENDSANAKSKPDWKSYSSGFGSAPAELRRSYSEKIRQGKDSLPLMHEVRGRKDLYLARQSFPVESSDSGWKLKLSSPSELFFHEDKKVSRKEGTRQSSDRPDRTDFSLVSTPRSRPSLYKDRRVDSGT
ncbi:Uncharacterized protein KIAA1671, partial [Buceros rhinoceros silvestris]